MKKIGKLLFAILGAILLLSSCKDTIVREPSPVQNGTHAYFSENNITSYSFIPADTPILNVVIGRNISKGKATVKYAVVDKDGVFNLPDSVVFADGSALDTIKVDFSKMPIGTTSTLSLEVDSLSSYFYGASSISITVLRDYKWVDAGVASMTSAWAGGTADVSIEHATGTYLYRLVSPYYVLEPTYCPAPGYHVQFLLDENYNAVSLPKYQNIGEAASSGGSYWLYWNAAKSYCSFTNVGNEYTINGAWAKGSLPTPTLSSYATESFVWTKGYPGAK